jgi:alkanesulfonate monooxygenase SsuD/methylene tetrahydromethanopterin reductase-like flavin-dependent oxidoreductase (luciferase family)
MLEDTINIARALMTEDNVTYEGKHFSLDGATYHPHPVQNPHIPIWVGASGERLMLPLVGRLADGWHSFGRPDDMNRKWAIVQKAAEAAGRDPATIERSASLSIDKDMSVVRERAEKWAEDGYEHIIVGWPTAGWPKFEEFCDKVLPDLAD